MTLFSGPRPTLLFPVYQLHDRKGCKPRTRSNSMSVNKFYFHIEATRAVPATNL